MTGDIEKKVEIEKKEVVVVIVRAKDKTRSRAVPSKDSYGQNKRVTGGCRIPDPPEQIMEESPAINLFLAGSPRGADGKPHKSFFGMADWASRAG